MKKRRQAKSVASAEDIARLADQGKDVSGFFTNRGKLMPGIQVVQVDFTVEMLAELDQAAAALHISRQALIKTLVRQGLDQRLLAEQARKTA
jgi:hypothetical protein